MGGNGWQDFTACSISQLNGGGGSEIITHNNYYCLKFHKWFEGTGYYRVNATLYKGATCTNWVSGDYCYSNPSACTKEFDWGWSGDLGNPSGYYVNLDYRSSTGYGPLLFFHRGAPVITGMGFHIGVGAYANLRSGMPPTERTSTAISQRIVKTKRLTANMGR